MRYVVSVFVLALSSAAAPVAAQNQLTAPSRVDASAPSVAPIAVTAAGGIVAAFFSRTDVPVEVTPIPAGARLSVNFGF